jgi:hypothetical protein
MIENKMLRDNQFQEDTIDKSAANWEQSKERELDVRRKYTDWRSCADFAPEKYYQEK